MIYNALRYTQNTNDGDQEFFLTVLPFSVLDKYAETLIYGENDYGYQRKLNEKHYKNISKSLLKAELISPTSIVLGIDEFKIRNIVNHLNNDIYELNIDNIDNKNEPLFRIIDGQHRIEGLKIACKVDQNIKDYKLSVIIMVIKENCRRIEAKVFKDINSKAKPLKMDLAILALYKYELLEKVKEPDIKEHVGIKIAHMLNENDGLWENAIILDVNSSNPTGCVGFKTFYESIKKICEIVIAPEDIESVKNRSFKEIVSFVEIKAKELIEKLLNPCWQGVRCKWEECFNENTIISNFEEIKTYFNNDYYIQKTMGCKAINGLIAEILQDENGNTENTINRFLMTIKNSKLSENDWKVGERFSGLSSEAGFRKIRELIKNNE